MKRSPGVLRDLRRQFTTSAIGRLTKERDRPTEVLGVIDHDVRVGMEPELILGEEQGVSVGNDVDPGDEMTVRMRFLDDLGTSGFAGIRIQQRRRRRRRGLKSPLSLLLLPLFLQHLFDAFLGDRRGTIAKKVDSSHLLATQMLNDIRQRVAGALVPLVRETDAAGSS